MTVHPAFHPPGCGCESAHARLLSIDAALACISAHATPQQGAEQVPLGLAKGRILAHPVLSAAMVPPFDNAAMDGYAVQTAALAGPGPWSLRVIARLAAGLDTDAGISDDTAARIFTGAPVPAGADAVVMQEEVTRHGDGIVLTRRPEPGLNIRKAGSDIAAGAIVLDAGRRLGARAIAACAAAGAGTVPVRPRLRVALLVTGDEVRPSGSTRSDAQIWDVNSPMLSALLTSPAVDLVSSEHSVDDRAGLARQLGDLAAGSDLIVTTGGISVGEEDHVKPALALAGGKVLFSGVAIKPGKPVSFGRLGSCLWLGLPGNPLSAFVTFQIFGTALLRRICGDRAQPARRHAVLSDTIRRKPGRCELRLAVIAGFDAQGREVARCDDATHSARVGTLPFADGLIFLPAKADHLPAGALVEFQPFCND